MTWHQNYLAISWAKYDIPIVNRHELVLLSDDNLPQDTPAVSGGVSRSAVSREAAEAGARLLKELLDRRWDEVDILVIYH